MLLVVDWSKDRIVPDLIKSIIFNSKFIIRSPKSTRPWQNVLDLWLFNLSRKIYGNSTYNGSWNFGPTKTCNGKKVMLKLIKILKVNKNFYKS